ncbi:MAG: hypothetical protein NT018_04790, partial [Armatimonadetes bacterium]|nr:hypothetical protein [Armatimonadota bacterium]
MKRFVLLMTAAQVLLSVSCSAQSVSGSKSVQLTVYNGNFALVKDTRTVDLVKGVNSIEVVDVAAQIDPTSILFKTLTAPNSVGILEQNYQYDLISPTSILNKSLGQEVTFTNYDSRGNLRTQTGTLI